MLRAGTTLLASTMLFALVGSQQAVGEPTLLSGAFDTPIQKIRIAVNSVDGSALAVWSQSDARSNERGRIYAAELTRQRDGGYSAGRPFLVSPDSGCHQRPSVAWLEKPRTYLIVWDTAYRDLKYFLKLDPVDDRPFRSSDVLARTFTPGRRRGVVPGPLGKVVRINDPATIVSLLPCAVPMTASDHDEVFVTYLGSNEGGKDGHHWSAGMWGARCTGGSDITIGKNTQMTSWRLIGAALSGFSAGGRIYAAGVKLDLEESSQMGRGGVMIIDPESCKVEQFIVTGKIDPRSHPLSDRGFGEVIPLPPAPAREGAPFTILGHSNVDFNIRTFQSDLAVETFKKLGPVDERSTLLDQRFFVLKDAASCAQQAYVLYQDGHRSFFYRPISSVTGFPSGAPVAAFGPLTGELQWMDVAAFGRDVLVSWAERKPDGRYAACFQKLTVK
ncbi:MAG: hypothetical protein AB1714_23580 [Acidobacteriota bacterium]